MSIGAIGDISAAAGCIATGLVAVKSVGVGAASSTAAGATVFFLQQQTNTSTRITTTAPTSAATKSTLLSCCRWAVESRVSHANCGETPGSHSSVQVATAVSHEILQFQAAWWHSDRPGAQSWHSVEASNSANCPTGQSSQLEHGALRHGECFPLGQS